MTVWRFMLGSSHPAIVRWPIQIPGFRRLTEHGANNSRISCYQQQVYTSLITYNPAVNNIRPKEAIEGAGISGTQLRNWKKCLPALKKKKGNTPSYSIGDVLALRMVRWLTESACISVSRLAPFSTALFKLCQVDAWPRVEHQLAVLNFETNSIETISRNSTSAMQGMGGSLIIDIGKLVTALRAQYFGAQLVGQSQLFHGPTQLNQVGQRQKRLLRRRGAQPLAS